MNTEINNYGDAKTWYENAGLDGWEWFPGFDQENLIRFALRAGRGSNETIRDYLVSAGQNPDDYEL